MRKKLRIKVNYHSLPKNKKLINYRKRSRNQEEKMPKKQQISRLQQLRRAEKFRLLRFLLSNNIINLVTSQINLKVKMQRTKRKLMLMKLKKMRINLSKKKKLLMKKLLMKKLLMKKLSKNNQPPKYHKLKTISKLKKKSIRA